MKNVGMNKNLFFLVFVIILILVISLIYGFFSYKNKISQGYRQESKYKLGNLLNSQIYTDRQYGFSLDYPVDWKIVDDKSFPGPVFMPSVYYEEKMKSGVIDIKNDCFLGVIVFSDVNFYKLCKSKSGEMTFGKNKFEIHACGFLGRNYYSMQIPNSNYIVRFDYNYKDDDCKSKIENSLSTVSVN